MLKLILATFSATVFWMSAAHAQIVGGRIICESTGGKYTECETGVAVANPKLLTQYSTEACTFGSTWGFYDTKLWVAHGCRGQFEYDAASPAPFPTPVPTVDCFWNSQNWQPYVRLCAGPDHWVGRAGYGFADANTCVYSVRHSRRGAVCNWTGAGFTPYDIDTNVEVNLYSYATIDACYASIP